MVPTAEMNDVGTRTREMITDAIRAARGGSSTVRSVSELCVPAVQWNPKFQSKFEPFGKRLLQARADVATPSLCSSADVQQSLRRQPFRLSPERFRDSI